MHAPSDPSAAPPAAQAALSLLSAAAVRTRADAMLALALADRLPELQVRLDRLEGAADIVLAVTRAAYPSLAVPFHARWRHFVHDGGDRWARLDSATAWPDAAARARAAFDLAIVSVLLDAGAGPGWAYADPASGSRIGRSEGLALASFDMFAAGRFARPGAAPLRADAQALQELTAARLADGFQVSSDNPLVGLDGRADLLRRLGAAVAAAPEVFARADGPRPGGLFDHLAAQAVDRRIAAPAILEAVLHHLGPIWPSRLSLGGVPLGDCWSYPGLAEAGDLIAAAGTGRAGDPNPRTLMPLHKLSQWLTYSLIEPLQAAGLVVTDIDGLTGLAEYRNGGLFIDAGVLVLRDPDDARRAHDVSSPLVVAWRALTVALLDRLAQRLRERLGLDAQALPLAKVLEGGTWAAGRRLARERRGDGSPPLRVISDGTVF